MKDEDVEDQETVMVTEQATFPFDQVILQSRQAWFDAACRRAMTPKKAQRFGNACQYGPLPDGTPGCFIGVSIEEPRRAEAFDSLTLDELVIACGLLQVSDPVRPKPRDYRLKVDDAALDSPYLQFVFLRELQEIHDNTDVKTWLRELLEFKVRWKIERWPEGVPHPYAMPMTDITDWDEGDSDLEVVRDVDLTREADTQSLLEDTDGDTKIADIDELFRGK